MTATETEKPSPMVTMSIPEFHAALKAQGVSGREHLAFRCPICGTIQSGADLMRATGKSSFDDVEKWLGFSCVGRFTGAGEWKRGQPAGKGCNWTLGGLFQVHKLEVIDEKGVSHARFEIATPEEAQAHERAQAVPA